MRTCKILEVTFPLREHVKANKKIDHAPPPQTDATVKIEFFTCSLSVQNYQDVKNVKIVYLRA